MIYYSVKEITVRLDELPEDFVTEKQMIRILEKSEV